MLWTGLCIPSGGDEGPTPALSNISNPGGGRGSCACCGIIQASIQRFRDVIEEVGSGLRAVMPAMLAAFEARHMGKAPSDAGSRLSGTRV